MQIVISVQLESGQFEGLMTYQTPAIRSGFITQRKFRAALPDWYRYAVVQYHQRIFSRKKTPIIPVLYGILVAYRGS